ncbi:MAG: hypothetical protein KC609_16090, partial [Myxococcales bacterium]|nr:hypothetical protein [Myxococcales bacterium]
SKGHWELGACKPTCDPANDPYRQYDAKTCQVVRFVCPEGTEYFSDECGCGCKPSLHWVVSCGTPVCYENQPAPTDVPTCKPDQQTGSPCSVDGQRCIPEKPLDCGRTLICLTSQPVVCPISQRKFKTGIRYLSESDKSKLYTDLKSIDLATLNATKGRDLYGYTSVTVAALQTQAKQLETLRRQIEALQKRVKALTHSTISK